MEKLQKFVEEKVIVYELNEATETYIPQIAIPEEKSLGKYGLLRWEYLKKHRKGTYQALLCSGRLNEHCVEINDTALDYFDKIVK